MLTPLIIDLLIGSLLLMMAGWISDAIQWRIDAGRHHARSEADSDLTGTGFPKISELCDVDYAAWPDRNAGYARDNAGLHAVRRNDVKFL
jgi:hypothetical protein